MSFRLNPDEEKNREAIESRIMDKIAQNQRDERAFTYHYPRNKDEWWKNVDTWWPELLILISNFAVDDLGKPLDPFQSLDPAAVTLEKMKSERDPELADVFESTWVNAPDHGRIHAMKGWDVLCDLCSESYVLNPE